jgi:hypothetical protein
MKLAGVGQADVLIIPGGNDRSRSLQMCKKHGTCRNLGPPSPSSQHSAQDRGRRHWQGYENRIPGTEGIQYGLRVLRT